MAKKILIKSGPTAASLPNLAFSELGLSSDQNLLLVGNGTSNPAKVMTSKTTIVVDFSDTPGMVNSYYKAKPLSTIADPAFQTNNKTSLKSGICEPTDGDVGIVVKGQLIARFTATGLVLSGGLTYTGAGGVVLSYGPTRPVSPTHGFVWHNTTLDVVEWWDSFSTSWRSVDSGSGSGLTAWATKTANYTASDHDRLIANTDGGSFTITLPAAPTNGAEVWIIGDFATRNLTIARNGRNIARVAEDLILNKDNIGVKLVYDSAITSWRVWS